MGLDLSGFGAVADLASGILDRFFPPKMDEGEKARVQLELQKMLQTRETALLDAQKSIIVSEMNQGDNFTKRARPMIVYVGLLFIFLVHVLLPSLAFFSARELPSLGLPDQFWWAWGGVCSIWVVGRSYEKNGAVNKVVSAITGN